MSDAVHLATSSGAFSRLEQWLSARPRSHLLILFLIHAIVFGPAVNAGFYYVDDDVQIFNNPFVRNVEMWPRIFTGSVWSFEGEGAHANFYRPLQLLSYWLIYRVAGANPSAYHLANLALYFGCALLVFKIGQRLLPTTTAALAAAVLWSVHPLHVEPAVWCSALPDVGAAFFGLWAFYLFLKAEQQPAARWPHFVVAGLVFLPAPFFKESALTLVALPLLYLWLMGRPRGWRERVVQWLPFAAAAGLYLAVRVAVLGYLTTGQPLLAVTSRELGVAVGLLGQHWKLFVWPHPLGMFREFDLASSLLSPWPWTALAVLAAAFLLRRRAPVFALGMGWWLVTLSIVLDYRQLSFPLVADRFSLVPSVGLCLALAWLACVWLPQRAASPVAARTGLALAAAVALAWGAVGVRTLPYWEARDYPGWVQAELRRFPGSGVLHKYWAGVLYFHRRDFDAALHEFQIAYDINRASLRPAAMLEYDILITRGEIAMRQGRQAEGLAQLEHARQRMPRQIMAYMLLGAHYFARGDHARAAEYFEPAARLRPLEPGTRIYLASCWMKLGRYRDAAAEFRAAYVADRDLFDALKYEAQAHQAAGDTAAAARVRAEYERLAHQE